MFKPNNTTTTFSVHVKGDTTYCFGAGREDFNKTVVNRGNLKADPANPGPGTYVPQHPIGHDALKFKLKSRNDYHDPARLALKKNIPPPGAYGDKLALAANGTYNHNSEYVNSKAAKWAPPYDRFKLDKSSYRINPGPGTYL